MNPKLFFASITGVFVFAVALQAHAADSTKSGCSSIFDGVAKIVSIDPETATVNVIPKSKKPAMRSKGDCLQGGDTVGILASPIRRVVIFFAGKPIEITAGNAYTVPAGLPVYTALAEQFLRHSGRVPSGVPDIPSRDTGSRGGDETKEQVEKSKVLSLLSPIEALRRLPTQALHGAEGGVVVGWRNGKPPYRCQVFSSDGVAVAPPSTSTDRWCAIPINQIKFQARIVVRDGQENDIGWNIESVTADEIPRPDWITSPWNFVPNGDRAAWGIWLWQHAPPNWRLQALSMLQGAAQESWLAGYLLHSLLSELPLAQKK